MYTYVNLTRCGLVTLRDVEELDYTVVSVTGTSTALSPFRGQDITWTNDNQ